MRRSLAWLVLLGAVVAFPLNGQTPACTVSKNPRATPATPKGVTWANGTLKGFYITGGDSTAWTCTKFPAVTVVDTAATKALADSSAQLLAVRTSLKAATDALKVATDSLAKLTAAPTPPPPPPVDTTPTPPPVGGSYPNRPATYTKVLAEFSGACPVPAGSAYELAISGCAPWTIVGNANVTQVDDPTDPSSPPKVWRVTMPAGGSGCSPVTGENGCATGTGSSTGFGRWGLPINATTVYASVWVKYSPNFWFQQISQKFLRLDIAGGAQALLIQASHNGDFLRASNEQIGQAYDPQITTLPSRGVWHQVEILVVKGQGGSLKAWLDGQLRLNYAGPMATAGNFTTFELHSEMGGGSFRLLQPQWFQIGHVLVAGQ